MAFMPCGLCSFCFQRLGPHPLAQGADWAGEGAIGTGRRWGELWEVACGQSVLGHNRQASCLVPRCAPGPPDPAQS